MEVRSTPRNAYHVVFFRSGTTWSLQQKLTASDGAGGDTFGSAAALDGDMAVVGAFYNDNIGLNAGAAFVEFFSRGLRSDDNAITARLANQLYDELIEVRNSVITGYCRRTRSKRSKRKCPASSGSGYRISA